MIDPPYTIGAILCYSKYNQHVIGSQNELSYFLLE